MKKIVKILALILAMTTFLAACATTNTDSAASASGASATADSTQPKTLTVGTLDSADGFDPTANSNCGLGLGLVYDTILKLNYETNEIEAGLAESWEWKDDTTLVLKIRENIKFSNGNTMTPEDVYYSLWRFVYVNDQFDSGYDDIDFDNSTIDGSTLTLKLKQSAPDLLYNLTNDRWASVICKSYVEASDEDAFWDKPIGTGPYVCKENTAGSQATYERRDDYWGDEPEASTITIRYYSESTTMMVDFENKVLDVALDIGETNYQSALSGGYGDALNKVFPAYDNLALTMPEYIKVFDDVNVRKAIALALDTTAITKAVYGSLGTVADSCLINGASYYEPVGVNEYNPEQAKQLLQEAGYEDGKLQLLMLFPSTPYNEKAATIIQAQLAEVGITVKVETGDFATVIPRLMNKECELGLFGTGGGTYTASGIFATIGATSTNAAVTMTDEEFNKYIQEGDSSTDENTRKDAYKNAQERCAELYRMIPIAYSNSADLYQSSIDNVVGLTARSVNLRYVTFK